MMQRAAGSYSRKKEKGIQQNKNNITENYRNECFESFPLYFAGQLVTVRVCEFTALEVALYLTNTERGKKAVVRETRARPENALINDSEEKKILRHKNITRYTEVRSRLLESKQNVVGKE